MEELILSKKKIFFFLFLIQINLAYSQETVKFIISSEPSEADIYIDGKIQKQKTIAFSRLKDKKVLKDYILRLERYKNYDVELKKGDLSIKKQVYLDHSTRRIRIIKFVLGEKGEQEKAEAETTVTGVKQGIDEDKDNFKWPAFYGSVGFAMGLPTTLLNEETTTNTLEIEFGAIDHDRGYSIGLAFNGDTEFRNNVPYIEQSNKYLIITKDIISWGAKKRPKFGANKYVFAGLLGYGSKSFSGSAITQDVSLGNLVYGLKITYYNFASFQIRFESASGSDIQSGLLENDTSSGMVLKFAAGWPL